MKSAILIDVETTGLISPSANGLRNQPYITEIFCMKVDDNLEEVDTFHSFVRPPISIPENVSTITGITDQTVANAPMFDRVYRRLCEFFLGTEILVAHNCPFDAGMLEIELRRMDRLTNFPWPVLHVCTAEQSIRINGYRMGLKDLYKHVTGEDIQNHHRAEGDVRSLLRVFSWMCREGFIK